MVAELRRLVTLRPGGKFELDLRYFRHWSDGVAMEWEDGYPTLGPVYSDALDEILGPPRRPDEPLTRRHEDIARSLQAVYEECAMHVLRGLWDRTHNPRLCLAGGCAMNSVANGKIRAQTPFREVYIQPAAGDNGTALGAAYHVWHEVLHGNRGFVMEHGYWGPAHPEDAVLDGLASRDDPDWTYTVDRLDSPESAAREAARLIAEGCIVGWYQGRMEWGARALGNRSILADPRRAECSGSDQHQDQVPREVQALCARGRGRGAGRLLRGRGPGPVHDPGVSRAGGEAGDHPGGDACGWERPAAEGERDYQPEYSTASSGSSRH